MNHYKSPHSILEPVHSLNSPVTSSTPSDRAKEQTAKSSLSEANPSPEVGSPNSLSSILSGRCSPDSVDGDAAQVTRKTSLIQNFLNRLRQSPPHNSSNISDRYFCRICHEGDISMERAAEEGVAVSAEPLISPCKCSGSVGLIHRSCLEKWLSTANNTRCEICGHQFSVAAHSRPLKQWLCTGSFGENHRNLTADVVCFCVLTPLAFISTYLCSAGANHYLYSKGHLMEAIGLIFLACFLCIIYSIWISLSLRFHILSFREWQTKNQDIRLVEVTTSPTRRPSYQPPTISAS